jgi:NADPH:quinone reductase-like Zn-dependent oxidoreductase
MPKAYGFTEYGGSDTQTFIDLPKPTPGPGEVLITVSATSVNPADWKMREGYMREFVPLDLPAAFGLEAAGTIEAVGDGVTGFEIGDEVFGRTTQGGYSEYALVSTDTAALKPAGVSFNDAATLTVGAATAYDGIEELGLGRGATLLLTGAGGGVGVAAVQIAIHRGVTVIGTAGARKKDLVESLGATHVEYGAGVADQIRTIAPEGVDAIYDLIGGDALRDVAVTAKSGAKIITAADPVTAGEVGGTMVARKNDGEVLDAVARLVEAGTLDPHVTEIFPLDRASEALALVEGGHAAGKIVIAVTP